MTVGRVVLGRCRFRGGWELGLCWPGCGLPCDISRNKRAMKLVVKINYDDTYPTNRDADLTQYIGGGVESDPGSFPLTSLRPMLNLPWRFGV